MPSHWILGCPGCIYSEFIDAFSSLCYNADKAFPIAESLRSRPRSRSEN